MPDRPRLAVVYDWGAASPTQIARAAGALADLHFVVPRSDHVRAALPLLAEYGEVTMMDRVLAGGSLRADGIVTFSERMLRDTARLADRLGLPFHTPAVATALTDKAVQRRLLAEAGVDTVRYRVVTDPSELPGALAEIGCPSVVKPRRGEGSRDTFPVHDRADAGRVVGYFTRTWSGDLIVEEFLVGAPAEPGIGDYVSVESAVVDGTVHQLAITGKFPTATPFRETGQFWPSTVDDVLAEHVRTLVDRALHALSVRTGLCHTEVRLTMAGPRIIEVNGRIGRDLVELATRAANTDLTAMAINMALNNPTEPTPINPDRVYFQYHHACPPDATAVLTVTGQDTVDTLPGVDDYRLLVTPPAPINATRTFHFDALTGHADSPADMLALIARASRSLTFTFESPVTA